jgi:hypothetical protein
MSDVGQSAVAAKPSTTFPSNMPPWQRVAAVMPLWEQARAAMLDLEGQLEVAVAHARTEQAKHSQLLEEYEAVAKQIELIEERIREVHAVLVKYEGVEDPVVGSDGFTYERRSLLAYFEDCRASNVEPRSSSTGEILSFEIMSNSTLRRIVDQLRGIRADGPAPPPQVGTKQPAAQQPPAAQRSVPPPPPAYSATRPPGAVQQYAPAAALPPQYASHLVPQPQQAPPAYGGAPVPQQQPAGGGGGLTFALLNATPGLSLTGNTHPCLRVYGSCNFGPGCAWAKYPLECCLSHLKGRCRYGQLCKELHVELVQGDGQTSAPASQLAMPVPGAPPSRYGAWDASVAAPGSQWGYPQ